MKISQLRKLIKEAITEVEIEEMARTAGTGGAYMITPEGEAILKSAKETGELPEGRTARQIQILKFLYQAKQEGKRAQKIDFANMLGVPQPSVNPLFNKLEGDGLISQDKYVSALGTTSTGSSRPKPNLGDLLGDLDI